MNKILSLITCLTVLAVGAHAQRVANLQAYIVAPDTGNITTMNCVDSYLVETGFINLGPDNIYPSDTIRFIDPFVEEDFSWTTSPDDTLKVGDTLVGNERSYFHVADMQNLLNASGGLVSAPFSNGNYYFFSKFIGYGGYVPSEDLSSDEDTTSIQVAPITINCSPTSVKEVNLNNTVLKVFPNPAFDQLSVSSSFAAASRASVRITDVAGRLIESIDLGMQGAGTRNFTIDVGHLNNGIYYIELLTDQSKGRSKFIKN